MKNFCFIFLMVVFFSPQVFASSNSVAGSSTSTIVGVNPTISGTINSKQNISPSSNVRIDSHAVNNSRYINRQFLQQGVPGRPGTMQYFGWKNIPWNVFPIIYGKWIATKSQKKVRYRKLWKHIYKEFTSAATAATVTFVKYGFNKTDATIVASVAVELTANQGTDDAQIIIASLARKYGGNIIEVLSSSAEKVPTSSGWHIGFGAGAGGVVGANEKGALTGAGGTGFGKSSISVESLPFMQVRIWHLAKNTKK